MIKKRYFFVLLILRITTAVTLQAAGQDFSVSDEVTGVIGKERLSPVDKKIINSADGIAAYSDSSGKPNVIIILTDDQGYGDLSAHGNPTLETPNIDKLHEESIRFTDFHVAPMCTPTRSQLMTGQDALSTGAFIACCGFALLDKETPTMADVFKANNYEMGLFGKWHLGDNYPYRAMDRGFKETVMHKGWGITSTADYWNNDYFDDYYWHNGEMKQYKGYITNVWFSEAMSWMREQGGKGRPFFTYLSINAPHAPLYVPDKYRQIYLDKGLPNRSGPWYINIEEDGEYEVALYRWPKEAQTKLRDRAPAYEAVDDVFEKGKALPVAYVNLRIGNQTYTTEVTDDDYAASFDLELKEGKTQLQTWFYDENRNQLSGAYHVYVTKKDYYRKKSAAAVPWEW